MPRGAMWLNRDKARPYVLATECRSRMFGTLLYGSTQETERAAGSASIEVRPRPFGVNANGLQHRTIFYPGVLLAARYDDLPPHAGMLHQQVAEMKQTLFRALGIGTGTLHAPVAPRGSRRGRIVLLGPEHALFLRTRHAVILTEHRYSAETRYQVIVPILRGDGLQGDRNVVRIEPQPWFRIFEERTERAFLAAPVIQSVWHPEDVASETPFVIDDVSLGMLEERLCGLFGLEAPGTPV